MSEYRVTMLHMSDFEMVKTTERHEDNNCGGELEVKVFRARKRVEVTCKKCKRISVIEKGKVLKDGAATS